MSHMHASKLSLKVYEHSNTCISVTVSDIQPCTCNVFSIILHPMSLSEPSIPPDDWLGF